MFACESMVILGGSNDNLCLSRGIVIGMVTVRPPLGGNWISKNALLEARKVGNLLDTSAHGTTSTEGHFEKTYHVTAYVSLSTKLSITGHLTW